MKERPILFSGAMVRAILEGHKTQTRRLMKPQPVSVTYWLAGKPSNRFEGMPSCRDERGHGWALCGPYRCPYGKPGDRLWVREAWRCFGGREYEYQQCQSAVRYKADEEVMFPDFGLSQSYRPSIHMPRWACRLMLEVVKVRVERLQEITNEDTFAEGLGYFKENTKGNKTWYGDLWEEMYGNGSWNLNPWVWVVEFKKL